MRASNCQRAAAGAAVVTMVLIASAAVKAGQAGTAPQTAAGDIASGKATFARSCEGCHGADGRGTARAPQIAGTTRTAQAFMTYVRNPSGTMPPQGALSDKELTDTHAYLRSLTAAPGAPAAAATPNGRPDVGARLFVKNNCYQCHVNEAQGGPQGPRLGPDPIPFARFLAYVRQPSGDMPPFTDKVISNADLADIYAFLQTRVKPPALDKIPLLTQ